MHIYCIYNLQHNIKRVKRRIKTIIVLLYNIGVKPGVHTCVRACLCSRALNVADTEHNVRNVRYAYIYTSIHMYIHDVSLSDTDRISKLRSLHYRNSSNGTL